MVQVGDEWYRYEDIKYAPPVDEWDNPYGEGTLEVKLRVYIVERITPKGVRLSNDRIVLESSIKKFACPTKELAKESFIKRKQRQESIISAQLDRVKKSISLIQKELG